MLNSVMFVSIRGIVGGVGGTGPHGDVTCVGAGRITLGALDSFKQTTRLELRDTIKSGMNTSSPLINNSRYSDDFNRGYKYHHTKTK